MEEINNIEWIVDRLARALAHVSNHDAETISDVAAWFRKKGPILQKRALYEECFVVEGAARLLERINVLPDMIASLTVVLVEQGRQKSYPPELDEITSQTILKMLLNWELEQMEKENLGIVQVFLENATNFESVNRVVFMN